MVDFSLMVDLAGRMRPAEAALLRHEALTSADLALLHRTTVTGAIGISIFLFGTIGLIAFTTWYTGQTIVAGVGWRLTVGVFICVLIAIGGFVMLTRPAAPVKEVYQATLLHVDSNSRTRSTIAIFDTVPLSSVRALRSVTDRMQIGDLFIVEYYTPRERLLRVVHEGTGEVIFEVK